jgi:Polyketide cyclase / dehydrase and lipid transport
MERRHRRIALNALVYWTERVTIRGDHMRITVNKTVDVSIDRAWSLVADFGNWDRVDPNIKTSSSHGEGVGAVREIALPEGVSAKELCVVCDSKSFTLAYTILPPIVAPVTNYVSTLRLEWAGPGKTTVEWVQVSEYTPDDKFPMSEAEFVKIGEAVYGRFIDGLASAK